MINFEKIITAIRTLVNGSPPDFVLSKLFYEHGCFYLLSKVKEQNEYTKNLRTELQLNKICIKERYNACEPIFKIMEQEAIPYAVIKGAVLSKMAYGDISIRKSGDIDLLIRRNDINTVKKFMIQNGFVQGRVTDDGIVPFTRQELIFQSGLSHQAAPFIKKSGNPMCPYINVDVNMDILWGESKQKSNMDFVMARTENIEICGISLKKLTPIMEFIALCLHHYKDMNSIYLLAEGSLKLSLFCDIFFYLKNNNIDKDELYNICCQLQVWKYVAYCLYFTNVIFGGDECSVENNLHLNSFGLNDSERQKWQIPFLERLFEFDSQAFLQTLTPEILEKININKVYM